MQIDRKHVARRCAAAVAVGVILLEVPSLAEHSGLWPDEIVFFETSGSAEALQALKDGDAHLAAASFAPWDAGYAWANSAESYGTSLELWVNPASVGDTARFSDGRLNPFALSAVRDVLPSLLDLASVAREWSSNTGSAGSPRRTVLDARFDLCAEAFGACVPDGNASLLDEERAIETIEAALIDAGCATGERYSYSRGWYDASESFGVVGLWVSEFGTQSAPDLCYHVSSQLSKAGIDVDLGDWTDDEAEWPWRWSRPTNGDWGFYVRQTSPDSIDREPFDVLDRFISCSEWAAGYAWPDAFLPFALPSLAADGLSSEGPTRYTFSDWAEYEELLVADDAFASSICSWRFPLLDETRTWMWAEDVDVLVDLAAGIAGSYLWGHTVRFVDEDGEPDPGGRIDVACPALFDGAWNPIGGTTSTVARMVQRPTEDWFLYPDPHTGLYVSHLVDEAICTVPSGLPMEPTHDYVAVEYEDEIRVPEDAWCAWSVDQGAFVTVGERHPDGLTARTKTVCTFTDDLFDNLWHDGSHVSVADFVMRFILRFEQGDEGSWLYDVSKAWEFRTFLRGFKGARITSTDPLTIEVYDDRVCPDPETQVFERIGELFWPYYGSGMAPWHTMFVGFLVFDWDWGPVLAEIPARYYGYDVPAQQNWIAGETLNELFGAVVEMESGACLDDSHNLLEMTPWTCGLLGFVDDDEVCERFRNLARFVEEHGHLWIGNGPMLIDQVDDEDGAIYGVRFDAYRHDTSCWLEFGDPVLAEIVLPEMDVIRAGEPWSLDVEILTMEGVPYPMDEIESVSYCISPIEEEWSLFEVPEPDSPLLPEEAELIADGRARIDVSAETTEEILSNEDCDGLEWRLDIVAILKPVALAARGSMFILTETR